MTPQIARLYEYVLPVFWPYLWLQLRWIFKRQDVELRTLLISITKWGQVHIVQVGDHWRAYRKPEAIKPGWDDPVWQNALPLNMADDSSGELRALFFAAAQAFDMPDAALQLRPSLAAGADTS